MRRRRAHNRSPAATPRGRGVQIGPAYRNPAAGLRFAYSGRASAPRNAVLEAPITEVIEQV
jgi:hypothetical protein